MGRRKKTTSSAKRWLPTAHLFGSMRNCGQAGCGRETIDSAYATGLLYSMQERGVASKTALTCAFISRQSPWYTYGGSTINASQPSLAVAFASATASDV